MKALRPLLFPAACFAAAWVITSSASKHRSETSPDETPDTKPGLATKVARDRGAPRRISGERLAEEFSSQPLSEWSALWEDFATHATAADLQQLTRLPKAGRNRNLVIDPDLIERLGREELAVRAGRPVEIAPESFSALAETDPEAAWLHLEKHNRNDHVTAALRTLAGRDPAGTLERYLAMPAGGSEPYDGNLVERDGIVRYTPLGSIFGAWARQDPTAAAAAVRKLPPSLRTEAANNVAMTWAFRDGPAAIRYILDFSEYRRSGLEGIRLDVMLRASFRTHPAETSKLMADSPALRQIIGTPLFQYVAMSCWADADPEGVVGWLLETEPYRADELRYILKCEPPNAARIIRGLAAAGIAVEPGWIESIHGADPPLGQALADELGIVLFDDPDAERLQTEIDPADACDRWIAALREHGDPDAALTALGWTDEMAGKLAARAARVFPAKAAELARLVPASSVDTTELWRGSTSQLARYWPELEPFLNSPDPSGGRKADLLQYRFKIDPAAAAEELLTRPVSKKEVSEAIQLWAPHDPAAAAAWLAKLPDGPARQQGELELAKVQAPYDPEAVMDLLTSLTTPDGDDKELWSLCLRRVMSTGGDWQRWLARMPADSAARIREDLETDARLLELARQSVGK